MQWYLDFRGVVFFFEIIILEGLLAGFQAIDYGIYFVYLLHLLFFNASPLMQAYITGSEQIAGSQQN